MLQRVQLAELPPRPDASPGLLRRRYSVPETIMRKYRVAQQRAECEESEPPSRGSAASLSPPGRGACSPCTAPRFARDRELMRKSALLRRMWGRTPPPCCCCCRAELAPRHARSLDGSHSELRSRSRAGEPPAALSVSTYQSHVRGASSCIDTITDAYTDTDAWRSDERVVSPPCDRSSAAATADIESLLPRLHASARDGRVRSSSSSTVPVTALNQGICASPGSEDGDKRSREVSQRPLAKEAPTSCEMLEIVVSEVLDARGAPEHEAEAVGPARARVPAAQLSPADINIDEYVSSVLVESLNSLTDRLECVTSSVGSNRKISVVEKEIKVKLQSTGVNTIVHLSPTSNNQIIFGNEELCDGDAAGASGAGGEAGERDACNNRRDSLSIRDEPLDQRNNNLTVPRSPADRLRITEFDGGGAQSDSVNRAVLQQIQKLFQDELQGLEPDATRCGSAMPGISHIEISNVDVYIDNNTQPAAPARPDEPAATQAIGAVGTGNYYEDVDDTVVVPRFSAFPHTDSMEVNTSSSDDAEMVASDCTSLVDSLDDPNSPRSIMLRRSFGSRRGERELVRSAIDVLDLLPESAVADRAPPKDKPEAFFIRIEDDRCDCDKENLNVAERMPEKIKQRLYRRHRRRQLRMECARRTKLKQMKRDADRQRIEDSRARRLLERDCAAIINALIDDVIAKIAQDEFKFARIKRRPDRPSPNNTEENHTKKNRKKELPSPRPDNFDRIVKREAEPPRAPCAAREPEPALETHHVRGKLSLVPRTTLPPDDACPRRLYQKSEIHEGNKCIEILEILEYVNGAHSSPETPSDESPGQHARSGKRSRIPVPVHEKTARQNKTRHSPGDEGVSPLLSRENRNVCDSNANVPSDNTERTKATAEPPVLGSSPAARRASVPPASEPRPRSDSLRFRRIFDIIPEERSSLSIDSSPDDSERRRQSAGFGRAAHAPAPAPAPATRSVATSPLAGVDCRVGKCPAPAGGPLRVKGGEGGEAGARERGRRARVWPALRRDEGTGFTCTPPLLPHRTASSVPVE